MESLLLQASIYLGAAVLVVPLSVRLGLGSVLGYLAAGILVGPMLGLTGAETADLQHFAEFGVVLMLFLVGLELQPARLWSMRRPIFGLGTAQVLGCTLLLCAAALLAGLPWRVALVGSLGLALSSTAIALQSLGERNLLRTSSGESAFSILLYQDIAAIPILALVAVLGTASATGAAHTPGAAAFEALKIVGVIAAIILGGRLLLRPLLRWIARSRTPEIFTAAALLLVVGIAYLMVLVGLSMALGAFLAGVLLAESEFRRELETDIEPFKGLLLGLFFIAVGMSIDFGAMLRAPLLVAALLGGFVLVKCAVIYALARAVAIPAPERPVFTLLLAQGGEFAFVVFQAAAGSGAMPAETGSLLIGVVALSMLCTPLLLVLLDRWVLPRYASTLRPSAEEEISEPQSAPVLICGFGRYGQIVARVLLAQGIPATVLDYSVDILEVARTFGYRVFYGDATRLDLLRMAGAAQARVLVLAVDEQGPSLKIAALARQHFPHLAIVARARDLAHWNELRDLGVTEVQREVFESSLLSARSVLGHMGLPPAEADALLERFRAHNIALADRMYPHHKDRARMIAVAREGRSQLAEQLAKEREERQAQTGAAPTEKI